MSKLVPPHGAENLKPLILQGDELKEEKARAEKMPQFRMTSRETGDLIMMAIGAFTPLDGFMNHDDWKGVVDEYTYLRPTFTCLRKPLFSSMFIMARTAE